MAVLSLVGVALALFVATNVDDLFVVAAFYADPRSRTRDVVVGQLVGLAAITAGSVVLSLAAVVVPARAIGFLGVVPLALGLHMAWRARRVTADDDDDDEDVSKKGVGVLAVSAVTIANGADNLTAYVPFFASRKLWESLVTVVVFVVMTGAWCALAHRLVHHPSLGAPIRRYGRVLLPWVLVALGVWLFVDAGAHRALLDVVR